MNTDLWKNYTRFYISQSTAFITPVLYIFLSEKFHINTSSILKISAFYGLLATFIHIPCGLLADRWGTKKNLYACLSFQTLSCISLLCIPNVIAYHIYLICICMAEGLTVSSSSILIRKQFKDSEENEFKYLFKLQNSFYLTTSIFILISSYLFTINENIPFALQIMTFILSAYFLWRIPEQYISNEKSSKSILSCGKNDLYKSFQFIFSERIYLFLIICSIFFGLGISVNQKAIQSQLFSLFEHHKVVMIGAVIAVSNLFSSVGARFFYSWITSKYKLHVEITILIFLLLFSYLLMSINSLISVIAGFMIINLFKGCYRPLIGAELVNRFPFKSSSSTNLALVSILCTLASALFQYRIAFFFNSIFWGNVFFAFFTFAILAVSSLLLRNSSSWSILESENVLTGKKNFVFKRNEELLFVQVYPSSVSYEELKNIHDVANKSGYPLQKTVPFVKIEGIKGFETKFLGETHLSDILDGEKQYLICKQLISQFRPNCWLDRPARIMREEHILPLDALEIIRKDRRLSQICIIHGDLHPHNIMVQDNQPQIIDWDLCGSGPLWYDLLSLLSHPNLYFDKQKRFELFLLHSELLVEKDLDQLFHLFCSFKKNQLKLFSEQDSKYRKLANHYSDHMLQYRFG